MINILGFAGLFEFLLSNDINRTISPVDFQFMASEETDQMLCYRWIVEFDCWRLWRAFSQLGSVDGIPNRVGSTYDPSRNIGDNKTDGGRLLVYFMCKISAAANELSAGASENGDDDVTTLEEAIDLLEPIYQCFGEVLDRDEVRDVQLCLKRHAVVAQLRKNDHARAKVTKSVVALFAERRNLERRKFRRAMCRPFAGAAEIRAKVTYRDRVRIGSGLRLG